MSWPKDPALPVTLPQEQIPPHRIESDQDEEEHPHRMQETRKESPAIPQGLVQPQKELKTANEKGGIKKKAFRFAQEGNDKRDH